MKSEKKNQEAIELNKPHKQLKAWQLGMEISLDIYKHLKLFPEEEKYGLVSQMKRCSVSIPSHIAEGAARNSKKEFVNFLYIALGSLSELDTQWELSNRLNFISKDVWCEIDKKLQEETKLLSGLIRSQKKKQ